MPRSKPRISSAGEGLGQACQEEEARVPPGRASTVRPRAHGKGADGVGRGWAVGIPTPVQAAGRGLPRAGPQTSPEPEAGAQERPSTPPPCSASPRPVLTSL